MKGTVSGRVGSNYLSWGAACAQGPIRDTPTSPLEVDVCVYHVNIGPSNYCQSNQDDIIQQFEMGIGA